MAEWFLPTMKLVRKVSMMNNHSLKCITAADSGEGAILPTWTAVDNNNVKTSRELWEYMKTQGWNVDVRRFMTFSLLPSLTWFNASITGAVSSQLILNERLRFEFSIPISPDRPIEVGHLIVDTSSTGINLCRTITLMHICALLKRPIHWKRL